MMNGSIAQSRIVLVPAVRVAMQPIEDAFRAAWPDAERVNLPDDSLSVDRSAARDLQPAMIARFQALTDYAGTIGAAAAVFEVLGCPVPTSPRSAVEKLKAAIIGTPSR